MVEVTFFLKHFALKIMHILQLDFVNRPSWQAQITGRKTWTLEPVPDCEYVCHQIKVTVNPGDISE